MNHQNFLLITLIIFLVGIGCSGTGSPVSPDGTPSQPIRPVAADNTYLWGSWNVAIDPVTMTAEAAPLRGAQFTANVTQFMQPPMSNTHLLAFSIDPASDFPSGYIVVEVAFTHPFPGLDTYTGFDVRGVCIGDGSIAGIHDSDILYAGPDEVHVLNADGLTRWFNPDEFSSYESLFGFTTGKLGVPGYDYTATLNGYKYFCDELLPDDSVPEFFADPACQNPRGYFSAGMTNKRMYELQFPVDGGAPVLVFQYAVVASWELPSVQPPDVPDSFNLSANCQEPYVVSTADQSDMFYEDPASYGGSLGMLVRVFDHQGAASLSTSVADEISAIYLENPDGLITGGIASFEDAMLTGALVAEDDISATYLLETSSVEPYAVGNFPVLVVVESSMPSTYDSGFPGFDFPTGAILSSYVMATVNVTDEGVEDEPPVAVAEIVTPEPYCPDDPIEFDGSNSYDGDDGGNSIVAWDWDFDGDGVYGDTYDSGTDENPTTSFPDFGIYEIDLRVTDDEGMTDTLDEPLIVAMGAATWVDDDNTTGPWDGTFDYPYLTIQDGIDNVDMTCGSGWVLVKDGTYEELITIVSNITVEGYSTPAPLITTAESATGNMVSFGSSSGSVIKHFQVQPRTTGRGIYVAGSNNTVEDIEFLDNESGATCSYAVQSTGTGHTIDNVHVDGYHKSPYGFIYMSGQSSTLINCVVLNLTFTGAGNMNVLRMYQGGSNSLFAKNVVGHIAFSQAFVSTQWVNVINFEYCPGSTFRNNLLFDIDNNLGDTGWTWGIDAYAIADATFEHNTISGISGPAWIYAFDVTQNNADPSGTTHRDHIITDLTAGIMNWRWAFMGSWGSILYVDNSCTYNVGNSFRTTEEVQEGSDCLINVNPMFLNPGNDDYRVSDTSPCHNTASDGTDMGAYGGSDPLTWLPD